MHPHTGVFPLHKCTAVAQTDFGHNRKEYVSIEIIDLSSRGLGFRTETPATTGAVFTVILRIPGIPVQTWTCRVVSVNSCEENIYKVGATFVDLVSQNGPPVAVTQDAVS